MCKLKKMCATCKYENFAHIEEPCLNCDNDYSGWVAKAYDKPLKIKAVNVRDNVTTVIFNDGSKTSVKCHKEAFNLEKGIAMACAKKLLGDDYYKVIRPIAERWSSDTGIKPQSDIIDRMQKLHDIALKDCERFKKANETLKSDLKVKTEETIKLRGEIDWLKRVYDGADARELRSRNEDLIKVNDKLACDLLKKCEEVIELKNHMRVAEYCARDIIATNTVCQESEIAELKQKVEDLERENVKLRAENGSLKIDLDRMKDAVKARDEKIEKLKTAINQAYGRNVYAQNATIKNLNRIVQDKNSMIDALKRQLEASIILERKLKAQLSGSQAACAKLRDGNDDLKRRIKDLTALHNATEVKRCELFREVQKLKSKLRDIHDTAHEGLDE